MAGPPCYAARMKLLDDLRAEHQRIEQVAGSLQAWAAARARGQGSSAEAAAFLRFFRLYAGRFHHQREEEVLAAALLRTEVPADRGPIAALLHAHRAFEHWLDRLEPLLSAPRLSPEGVALARRYAAALLQHLDAENSVLFPESEIRFRRAGVAELEARAPDARETAARDEGALLCAAWPPQEIPGLLRGDGCCACPDYGARCEGVEQAWWSELEWEDARGRSEG